MNLLSRAINKISRSFRTWSHLQISRDSEELKTNIENIRQMKEIYPYVLRPKFSIILQFFNKRKNISNLITNLRLSGAEEIIIIDDGSIDGSYEDWLKVLDRPNDFLLRCNDLFEVRTYDRAIGMAKGEFVCLLQDDDLPPPNNLWLEQALKLFELFPKLVILGGRDGMDLLMPDFNHPVDPQAYYQRTEDIFEWKGVHKLRLYWKPGYIEPNSGIPFRFTMAVNRAPTFLRRKEFSEIGGINQNYAPFQLDDDEACIRTWLAGYQVGFYPSAFIRGFDVGGMSLFNTQKRSEQVLINAKQLYAEHGQVIADGSVQKMVDMANSILVERS